MVSWQQAFTESDGKPDLAVYKKVIEKNFGAGTDWQVNLSYTCVLCLNPNYLKTSKFVSGFPEE